MQNQAILAPTHPDNWPRSTGTAGVLPAIFRTDSCLRCCRSSVSQRAHIQRDGPHNGRGYPCHPFPMPQIQANSDHFIKRLPSGSEALTPGQPSEQMVRTQDSRAPGGNLAITKRTGTWTPFGINKPGQASETSWNQRGPPEKGGRNICRSFRVQIPTDSRDLPDRLKCPVTE